MSKKIHVDELWEEAKAGQRKLTPKERRRVLVYLDEIGDNAFSNIELAKFFKVDEKVVRNDKKRILTDIAHDLTPEAQMLIVARHMADLDELIVKAKQGRDANDIGVLAHRFYIETLKGLYRERRETLENIGVIRKELGTLNVNEEHWVATVDTDTGTLGVHQFEAPKQDE